MKQAVAVLEPVEPLIREIRGERVMLDADLARKEHVHGEDSG